MKKLRFQCSSSTRALFLFFLSFFLLFLFDFLIFRGFFAFVSVLGFLGAYKCFLFLVCCCAAVVVYESVDARVCTALMLSRRSGKSAALER